MNTKEAIKKVRNKYEGWQGYARTQKEVDQLGEERDEIIDLLKRGKEYEQMWEKVKEDYGEMKDNCPEGFKDRWLFAKTIKLYEQKYFPKGDQRCSIIKKSENLKMN